MNEWICLIMSLPSGNAALRQRTWRALKSSGAAVLRDGVYLLPDRSECRETFERLGGEVRNGQGTALVLQLDEPSGASFRERFDRSGMYAELCAEVSRARQALTPATVRDLVRQTRKLRKAFGAIVGIDYFPGESQRQVEIAISELERDCASASTPDEPHDTKGGIPRRDPAAYQGRTWATRQRPWVDRLASAWLIRRRIDPQASMIWLAKPDDCPPKAVGFDFDGAEFSHVRGLVTYEVLASSFGLNGHGLERIGAIVRFLDVGGVEPPEAVGVESVLAGLRNSITDDDALLDAACFVFDALFAGLDPGDQSS